jgi:hypothetical protein
MSTEKHELSLEERRSRLERRAEVIRSRLFRHVDALDARRHKVTDQVEDVSRRAKQVVPAAIGVVVASGILVGAGISLISWAFRARKKQLLSYRIAQAIEPFRAERRPSVLGEVGRKVLVSLVTVFASQFARIAAKKAASGQLGALLGPKHDVVVVHESDGASPGAVLPPRASVGIF